MFVVRITLTFSVWLIIIANLIPLLGVIILDWSLLHIMVLFWAESAVIGFYNIFKMFKVSPLVSLFMAPFFTIHYGGFMTAHLIFIFAFFGSENLFQNSASFFPIEGLLQILPEIYFAIFALILSHGFSFFYNFMHKRELEKLTLEKLMTTPYKRIIIMHITIIFGGWLIMLFKEPVAGFILLIIFKLIADIKGHQKEHSAVITTNG